MEGTRYRVLRALGRGGMGDVLLVHDAVRDEDVALKRVLSAKASAQIRFKREFRVIADLLHPNLVRLHELGEDGEGLYFTMEAIDGSDLATYCAPSAPRSGTRRKQQSDTSAPTVEASDLSSADTVHDPRSAEPISAGAPTAISGDAPTIQSDPDGEALRLSTRPAGAFSIDAVLHVAPQLLEALAFLHAHGIVHRDLKPANVMVRADGVVKVLDFGILASPAEAELHERGELIGTLGFMSPDQLRGAPPTPADDLYALGATLYNLLTGGPIFEESNPLALVFAHQQRDPTPLAERVEVPAPLAEIVDALLAREANERPGLDQVAEALARAGARLATFDAIATTAGDLHGRASELETIVDHCRRALAGRRGAVVIVGGSGSGKTALAEHAARTLGREGAWILKGRGRANERLPFNALDAVVDQLALTLDRTRRPSDQVHALRERAAHAFPILARDRSERGSEGTQPDSFRALRDLLDALAGDGGAVVQIDDLQWADADSLRALGYLAPPNVVVLATLRDDIDERTHEDFLPGSHPVPIAPLDDEALAAIVRDAAERAGAEPDEEAIAGAVALSRGRPFLAEVAGRALARGDSGDPLDALILSATEEAAPLLAALVAADDWMSVDELARHGDRTPGAIDDQVRVLAKAGVVRRIGGRGPRSRVDLYHDAIRARLGQALVESIGAAHDRFATLAIDGELPLAEARVVRHLLSAGRATEAATHALAAAQEAHGQLAFGLEAEMLAVVLTHGTLADAERTKLLRRRAESLERCARYTVAAECWDELAALDPVSEREAKVRAAHALLGANQVDAGAKRIAAALSMGGDGALGGGKLRNLWSGVRFLLGPKGGTPPPTDDPVRRAQAEADVRLGMMLGFFDPLQGVRILVRARDAFHALGDAERLAWCDMLFACYADFGHAGLDESKLARRYRDAAEKRAAEHGLDVPELHAVRKYLEGTRHMRVGAWAEAEAAEREAMEIMEAVGKTGTFEHTYANTTLGTVAFVRQDIDGVRAAVERFEDIQRDGGDLTLATHLGVMKVGLMMLAGDFDRAREAIAAAEEALPKDYQTIQRAVIGYIGCIPEIYDGTPERAVERAIATDPLANHYRLLQSHVGAIHGGVTAIAEAQAMRVGSPKFSRRRLRKRLHWLLKGEAVVGGVAQRVYAYIADAKGKPEEAIEWMREAVAKSGHFGRRVDESVARYQLGLRIGGDEGAELRERARRDITAAGAATALLHEDPVHR